MLSDLHIEVDRTELANAVAWVARNIGTRHAHPVLAGLLLTAKEDKLTISSFNNENAMEITLSALVVDEGQALVSGKLLSDICRVLPKDTVILHSEESKLLIECKNAKFTLPTMPVEDFPPLPEMPTNSGSVPVDILKEALSQVVIATRSTNEVPMLTGIQLEVNDIYLTFAATDRYRLAVRRVEWDPHSEVREGKVLIPGRLLAETVKSYEQVGTRPVEIALGSDDDSFGTESIVGLLGEDRYVTSRLIGAEFPNYAPLLPKTRTSFAQVDVTALKDVMRRMGLMTKDALHMEFVDEELRISAGGEEKGYAKEVLPIDYWGDEPLSISFNISYLTDGLSAITTPKVLFSLQDSNSPVLITNQLEDEPERTDDGSFVMPEFDYIYLLMPVRSA